MRKILILLLAFNLSLLIYAQNYVVYSITGNVEKIINGKSHKLRLREELSKQSVLNVPMGASCELLDAMNNRKYTIRLSGQGKLIDMLNRKGNSVKELTQEYFSFLKSQISGTGETVTIRCSDPATIKRQEEILDSLESLNDSCKCKTGNNK